MIQKSVIISLITLKLLKQEFNKTHGGKKCKEANVPSNIGNTVKEMFTFDRRPRVQKDGHLGQKLNLLYLKGSTSLFVRQYSVKDESIEIKRQKADKTLT